MNIKLGRSVGNGSPCFITFEAGPTHNGLESAKRLCTLAANAGADAVKFQILDPDRLVADKTVPFPYKVLVDRATEATETVTEPLYELLRRRALRPDEWREIKRHCDTLGLAFFATVGFDEEVEFVADIGCQSIKIASADVNHLPLIRRAARTGLCIQLDTGNATIGEVESAVEVIRGEGNESIIIHHCPSGYPARIESINLNVIPTLKRMFPYPIAYSDHTPGWEMDVAAVALGANLVEKTITEDRMTRSIEHIMSLEPAAMAAFVRVIREVETALGNSRRILHPEEKQRRLVGRRSMHLGRAARKGERLGDVAIEFRRPGYGLGPDLFDLLCDRKLARDLPADHCLSLDDLV